MTFTPWTFSQISTLVLPILTVGSYHKGVRTIHTIYQNAAVTCTSVSMVQAYRSGRVDRYGFYGAARRWLQWLEA